MLKGVDIKELRQKVGKTQIEMGKDTGISRERIAQWESGKGNPKADDHAILVNYFTEKGVLRPQENEVSNLKDEVIDLQRRLLNLDKQYDLKITYVPKQTIWKNQ